MAPKSVSVTVKYSNPGTQPPIFLAGSFSDPAWQPQEMQYTTDEAGEHEFYKEVQVEEGRAYQYKFRIGEGDWWLLNEDSPTATDDIGNRNNLLAVPVSEDPAPELEPEHVEQPPAAEGISHPVADMENPKTEPIAGDETVKGASDDTQDEKKEDETTKEQPDIPTAEEHHLITPANTNTPAGETVEDEEDGAPSGTSEAVDSSNDVPLNVQHVREDATTTAAIEDDKPEAQHSAEPTRLLHATDGAHSQEEEGQLSEPSLTPLLPGTVEPPSTPAVEIDQAGSETTQPPTLVVEKVDTKLQHGDDFGSAATVAQKDAHLLRSRDALPDHVIMRTETHTPELAATAFEVSESAALLDRDRDPPTPPISDEEAGRIGFRRLSSTPIPEVAKTAAEVADVAATLDENPTLHLETAPTASTIHEITEDYEEDHLDTGASTPASQKAPRFSHECLGEFDHLGVPALPTRSQPPFDPLEPLRSPYDEPTVVDWDDPSLEMFPTDRAAIIHTIRRLSERLPEDVPNPDIVPPSPVIGPNGQLIERQWPAPSPIVLAHQASPSLDSITEENYEHDGILGSLPEASALPSNSSEKQNMGLSRGLSGNILTVNGVENDKLDATHDAVEPEPIKSVEVESETIHAPKNVEVEEQTKGNDIEPEEVQSESVADENREPDPSSVSQNKVEEPMIQKTEEASVIEPAQGSGEPELTSSKDQSEEKPKGAEKISSDFKEVGPETPPAEPVEKILAQDPQFPSSTTPIVIGNRQLGHDEEEIREITTTGDNPNITIHPATPAASTTEFIPKSLDAAKSTAIEEENGRTVKSRKNPKAKSPERPVTPNSMRSASRGTRPKNFLKAFWHVLFVDWIGGLIRALCGGRGGNTLLAVWVTVLVVIAPTLYSSYTGSSLWERIWSFAHTVPDRYRSWLALAGLDW